MQTLNLVKLRRDLILNSYFLRRSCKNAPNSGISFGRLFILLLLELCLLLCFFASGAALAAPSGVKVFVPFEIKTIKVGGKVVACAKRKAKSNFQSGELVYKSGSTSQFFYTYSSYAKYLRATVLPRSSNSGAIKGKILRVIAKANRLDATCRNSRPVPPQGTPNPSATPTPASVNDVKFVEDPHVTDISDRSTKISFMTNVDTIAKITYGLHEDHHNHGVHDHHTGEREVSIQDVVEDISYSTLHEMVIDNLASNTMYHATIEVTDRAGQKSESELHFQTLNGEITPIELQNLGAFTLRENQLTKVTVGASKGSGEISYRLVSNAIFATLTDNRDGTATFAIAPLTGNLGIYDYEIFARDAAGQEVSVKNKIYVYPALPPEPPAGAPGNFMEGMHHDPYIPNFAGPVAASGKNLITTTSDGTWTSLYSSIPANSVLIIKHRIVFNAPIANLDTIAIYPGGRLEFATNVETQLSLVNLQVFKGGRLEVGTLGNPITAKAEIIFKDVQFDLIRDPGQFGNGLISSGEVFMHGRPMNRTWLRFAVEPKAGDRVLTLEEAPTGWMPGDKLIIPDSSPVFRRQWEENAVQSINGSTLTLAAPLAYNHPGAINLKTNQLEFLPHVANLSRNVILRSQNPNGVRGHTMTLGRAHTDIRYVALQELGRTKALVEGRYQPGADNDHLDSTVFGSGGVPSHIGTNQIGRYVLHFHHAAGPRALPVPSNNPPVSGYQEVAIGNAIDGSPKWGIVIHGTHFGLFRDNVIYKAMGAGIVTENAAETKNIIERNFAMRSEGAPYERADGRRNLSQNDFGFEGAGFWFHGSYNYVRNNVSVNNGGSGYGIFHIGNNELLPRYPLAQGDDPHESGQWIEDPYAQGMPFLEFNNNEAYGIFQNNSGAGGAIELWTLVSRPDEPEYTVGGKLPAGPSVLRNIRAWHNAVGAIITGEGRTNSFSVDGLVVRQRSNDPSTPCNGYGIHSSNGYTWGFQVKNADIQGVNYAFMPTKTGWTIENSFLKNCINVDLQYDAGRSHVFRNVKFEGVAGGPSKTILYNGKQFYPDYEYVDFASYESQKYARFIVYNHQGSGKNYEVFLPQQMPNTMPLARGMPRVWVGCPLPNMNTIDCFMNYGYAPHLQISPCQTLQPGFDAGATCEFSGLVPPEVQPVVLNQPMKTFITLPFEGAVITSDFYLSGAVTGNHNASSGYGDFMIQVDNKQPYLVHANGTFSYWGGSWMSQNFQRSNFSTGPHRISTWVVDRNNSEIAGSRSTVNFTIQ